MDACARRPEPPAPDRSTLNLARGAFGLGELALARGRLRSPRWRLHALLALIPAGRALDLATGVMAREVRPCLDRLAAGRRTGALAELEPRVRAWLETWITDDAPPGTCRADLLQGLAASLSAPAGSAPDIAARALLAAGRVAAARELAAGWRGGAVRRRLEVLTATGVWGRGRARRFVAPPFACGFPPSLPRFVAMARSSQPGAPLAGGRLARAEALLARLEGADRQIALAHWTVAATHAGGREAGERAVRAIRYPSRRRLARLWRVAASLEAGRLDDAWRVFEHLAPGAFRERVRLLLARELIHRGRPRRARTLLAEPVLAPRREERDLLLCELEPRRTERVWKRWRESAARPSEDLAAFVPGLPGLAHRWTILALRTVLAGGLPEDDRQSVERVLWIPGRAFRAFAHDRAAVRAWLRDVEAGPHALRDVLRVLRWVASDAVEPIWSERLTLRAGRLGDPRPGRRPVASRRPPRRLAEACVRGLSGRPLGEAAGRSVTAERSAFDEGVSLSPLAGRRRRVVLGAVQHCLRSWLGEGAEPPRGALESRLRTLSNLAGPGGAGADLGVEHLVRALAAARRPSPAYRQAFAALVALAPERAAPRLFREHAALLFEHPGRARELLLALEDHGALEPGLNRPWGRFAGRVRARLGARPATLWLRELMAAWPGGPLAVPTFSSLECCASDLSGPWPATGGGLIARARHRLEALLATPTPRLPAALLDDPVAVKRLLWLRPSPPARRPPAEAALRTNLTTLRDDLGEVDVAAVLRLARLLAPRRPRPLARRLLLGRHPAGPAPAVELPGPQDAPRHRLRFLDKRRHLFTFLRFADCVPCCFDSASSWYRNHYTAYWVLSLWKDPLSFCFHVERRGRGGAWTPRGFVFGGFSAAGPSPAVLLNGVYLRRQEPRLRAAVLRALEDTFCRPLGVRRLAVANRYGGYGALPPGYARRAEVIHRLRALRYPAGPARYVYDDVSSVVNQTVRVDHLYWKAVGPAGSGPCAGA